MGVGVAVGVGVDVGVAVAAGVGVIEGVGVKVGRGVLVAVNVLAGARGGTSVGVCVDAREKGVGDGGASAQPASRLAIPSNSHTKASRRATR